MAKKRKRQQDDVPRGSDQAAMTNEEQYASLSEHTKALTKLQDFPKDLQKCEGCRHRGLRS